MYVHILDYMSTDSTFLCLMYNVLYGRGKIIFEKKNYSFVELLFIKSKLLYSYSYILQKNLILTLFYIFVESFFF